ncbi:MAG: class I SAM-dependent rRNA methyltransferase [Planctomycetes bacterium]|nr:class I SAM-dependent rRNA methyltransferase [Planctomycetota bacterium]
MGAQSAVRLRTVVPAGSAWIFRKMVREADERTPPGSVVRVLDRDGLFVAQAFWNPRSELALRVLSRDEAPIDDEWFRRTVARAVALRKDVLRLDGVTNAWRAVFSEADGIPGLIVDRFANVLSCQVSTLGAYRAFPVLIDELKKRLGATVVHVSADPKIAKLEGFPVPQSAGDAARVVIREHGLDFEVDCAGGHKTGFFLDQRDSRLRVRELARGRRALDLCSYTGGFALNAAKGDAASVTAVDLDEKAVAQARYNADLNKLGAKIKFVHADVFEHLRSLKGALPELVIVDPAKQAMQKDDVQRALGYYHDLNALVFEHCAKDALVLSCSCTGMVSEHAFLDALSQAAISARRSVTFLEVRGAPADHPVPSNFPQARYLKAVLVRVE